MDKLKRNKIFAGQSFGSFVVLEDEIPATKLRLRCSCGYERSIRVDHLLRQHVLYCTCASIGKRSPLYSTYRSWKKMHDRCSNLKCDQFKFYGKRGIKVCEQWKDFDVFLADMGSRPIGLTLDRVDNNKGYSPDNCQWADQLTQSNNQRSNIRLEYLGEIKTLSQWAREKNMKMHALYGRIKALGWSVERALETPIKTRAVV